MVESLNNNLENVRAMALQLCEKLDGYAEEKKLVDMWFSDLNEEAQKHHTALRKVWSNRNIKNPPSYIPASEIPTRDKISQLESAEKLALCVGTLFNVLRFLRLVRGAENDLPVPKGPELSIEIIGGDIGKVGAIANAIRDAITKVLPLRVSNHFSAPRNTAGFIHETIDFKYIYGCDEELQDAVAKVRISILAKNMGFEFDEEKMVANID